MDPRNRIEQLRGRLAKLEVALDPETFYEIRAEVEAEIRELEAGADTGGGGGSQVAASQRSVAVQRDAVNSTIITGDGNRILATDADPELLLKAYLASLAEECGQLPLGVIDTQFAQGGVGPPVRLPEVYVELDVTVSSRPAADDEQQDWAWRLVRGDTSTRMPARDALARPDSSRHVLLGDPGSGKTTLAHRLCRALADGEELPEGLHGLLPVRFVLREVAARRLSGFERGTAGLLWDALTDELGQCLGSSAAPRLLEHVRQRLYETGGFVVLDGLDEVPESGRRREVVLEAVSNLAATLRDTPSRLLVTARPYAYADPEWHLEDFAILALAPFSRDQVEQFVDAWYLTAARRVFAWSERDARGKADQLRGALANRRYLGDLASRPLLLTLMATLHSSWGQLPQDRADLYEETVKLLLGRWQRARESTTAGGETVREESLSQLLRVPEVRLRGALEALAFSIHAKQATDPERDDRPADISEGEILVAFKPLLGELSPDELLHYLEDRAGLLINRRQGLYAFPHRSFQEYLAACHLGGLPDPTERFRERAFEDPAWWREVVLLGIGRARRAGLGNAVAIVTTLLPAAPEELGEIAEGYWPVAVLGGLALLDLGILEPEHAELQHYQVILKRVRGWLVRLVEEGRLAPKERVEAGDVLGRLGDPRPGVGVVNAGDTLLPDIDWVEIPAGPFMMGSADDDPLARDEEKPQHEVSLDTFWISRYPITNQQFRLFWESGGYDRREYWTDAGWSWREGADVDVSIYPKDFRDGVAAWFAGRPKERRDRPFFWDDEKWSALTRPVVGITWYEAVAFCRWLDVCLRRLGAPRGVGTIDSSELRVSLPTEAHWEKAARGGESAIWPLGTRFDEDICNSKEADLEETSPVGVFPQSKSFHCVFDLAGNVWEWTCTKWGKDLVSGPEFKYPFNLEDCRNDLSGESVRVLRGGSFFNERNGVRCAARYGDVPAVFFDLIGFRVVLSLANSEF